MLGRTPNPTGRNGWERERREARQKIVDLYLNGAIDQIGTLSTQADDQRTRLEASKWLAEQILGKAQQAVTGPDGEPIKIDIASLSTRLKELEEKE